MPGWTPLDRAGMAARAARDIPEGWLVNLGIGIPTEVANYIPPDREVIIHAENGVIGAGPAPAEDAINPYLINAGTQPITLVRGGSYVHHADSFAIARGGHLDLCILGAFEVSETGDLANWARRPDEPVKQIGGAMDLAIGAKRLWIIMEHTTKEGGARLVRSCGYPLTARGRGAAGLYQSGGAGRHAARLRGAGHGAGSDACRSCRRGRKRECGISHSPRVPALSCASAVRASAAKLAEQIASDCGPHHVMIDMVVGVPQPVSHTADFIPRLIRHQRCRLLPQPVSSFANASRHRSTASRRRLLLAKAVRSSPIDNGRCDRHFR